MQQLKPLRRYHRTQLGYARDVAARPIKAGDEAEPEGSLPVSKTIGMVMVAVFAASAAGVVGAAITLT